MRVFWIGLAAFALLLSACAEDDNAVKVVGSSGSNVSLQGNWAIACTQDDDGSALFNLTFSDKNATSTSDSWISSTSCSGTADYSFSGSASVTTGETKSATFSASTVTVTKFVAVTSSDTLTPNTDAGATYLNGFSAFGFSDWASGTSKDITGIDSDGATESTTSNDIVFVDDSSDPDRMYFGEDSDDGGTLDSDGYPESVDSGFYFERQ